MNKKTIKAKIAAALSASMVITTLAPAMPAYAATSLNFNFTAKNKSLAGFILQPSGTVSFTGSGSFPTAGNLNGLKAVGNGTLYMPFYDNIAPAGYKIGSGNLDGKTWTELGLKGYEIDSWWSAEKNGSQVNSTQMTTYQSSNNTYYVQLKAGTGTDSKYLGKVVHAPKSGTAYVPGLPTSVTPGDNNADRNTKIYKVLDSFQVMPASVDGYKVSNLSATDDGDSGKTIKIETTSDYPTELSPSAAGFEYKADSKFVVGTMINRPVTVTYKYMVDPDKKFNLKVSDDVYEGAVGDAMTSGTKMSEQLRVTATQNEPVLTDMGTKNIKPNAAYIGTGAGLATERYILDTTNPVTIEYSKGATSGDLKINGAPQNTTTGEFQNGATVIKTLIPAHDQVVGGTTVYHKLDVDTDHKLIGDMPNQNVTLHYNYRPNPNFTTTISVQYVDNLGNDLTPLVADKAGITSTTPGNIGDFYIDPTGDISVKTGSSQDDYRIPVPVLDTYSTTIVPTIEATNPTDWVASYAPATLDSSVVSMSSATHQATKQLNTWTTADPYYKVTTDVDGNGTADAPTKSVKLIVTYTIDTNSVTGVQFSSGMGGKLMKGNVDFDPTNPTHAVRLVRENVNAGTYEVEVKENLLPTPTPDPGYSFDTWKYSGQSITLPHRITGLPSTRGTIGLTATFKTNPSDWNEYNLVAGDSNVSLLAGNKVKIVNKDSSGNQRTIDFSELDNYTQVATGGVNIPAGYTLKWYSQDDLVNPLTSTSDISSMSGKTFTAYAESSTPAAVYDPTISAVINERNGKPTIKVDPSTPAPMDTRLQYIVTDENSNVVAIIPGIRLMQEGGDITGDFLVPGNKYKVHTALSTVSPIIGQPVPTSGVSQAVDATIPVSVEPLVTEDSTHSGRAAVTIDPTSPNTEYALVDENGNEEYTFTAPDSNNRVVFRDLEPDKVYRIVPRKVGSNDSVADRLASGAKLDVDTSSLGLNTKLFDVTVIANDAPLPTNVKVDGTATSVTNLNQIEKGKTVELVAEPLDNNSNVFKEWYIVTQNVTLDPALNPSVGATPPARKYTSTDNRLIFKVPVGNVKVQAVYDTGTNWEDIVLQGNAEQHKKVGVTFPSSSVISENGDFRILATKNTLDAASRANIAKDYQDPYTGMFKLNVVVQKKDASGNWVDYSLPSGQDIDLDTNIATDALLSTRTYKFSEIATGSNAIELDGDLGNPKDSYQGSFNVTLKAGHTYALGYTKPATYRVTIRDMKNVKVTSFEVNASQTVKDMESFYRGFIKSDEIDNDGVKWHYEGLSTDKDTYNEYMLDQRVTDDITLYMFYSNDRAERNKVKSALEALIAKAKGKLSSFSSLSQSNVQAQIDAAQAVLDKINRKASADELQKALDDLQRAYDNATGNNGGGSNNGGNSGGGGRGGSGGGGSSANILTQKTAKTATKVYVVGTDGNWELTNSAEHKWVFKLNSGTDVKGWNLLSYQHNGQSERDWYFFDDNGIMKSGWFYDTTANAWYYLSEKHDGFFGRMEKGWLLSESDNNWYYLNPESGAMHTGWLYVGEHWYFLNNQNSESTWSYNETERKWEYKGNANVKPIGAMYKSERTPDGYQVNADGVWVK